MKRLLIIILALTLCLAGCKEEPKVPDTPEVKHTEEVKAPVEETPTEPAEEPEEEPDENVIILPEPDENTKVITIEFPEDFPEEPYTEPNLVSPEEFEWGEYVPFVRIIGIQPLHASAYIYDFAVLSKEANDLSEARELYSKLNDKYLLENPVKDYEIFGEKLSNYPEIANFLYKSRIERTTADLSKMLRVSYVESGGSEDNTYCFSRAWNTRCDLIENGEIKETIVTNEPVECITSADEFNFEEKTYIKQGKKVKLAFQDKYYLHKDGRVYTLYSLENAKPLYQFNLPNLCYVEEYSEDYLLLEFYSDINDNTAVYLYDITEEELRYMESFAFNSSISPDKKYIAYTSNDYDAPPQFLITKNGFYVKNIEDNTTVFYPFIYEYYQTLYIQSWIKEDCLF